MILHVLPATDDLWDKASKLLLLLGLGIFGIGIGNVALTSGNYNSTDQPNMYTFAMVSSAVWGGAAVRISLWRVTPYGVIMQTFYSPKIQQIAKSRYLQTERKSQWQLVQSLIIIINRKILSSFFCMSKTRSSVRNAPNDRRYVYFIISFRSSQSENFYVFWHARNQ